MKKWVIGIILSLSVTFMIGILNVSAYAIDLPTQSSYEQARHLWDDSWSVTSNGKMNQLCFYVGNDSDTSGNVYCVFNSWPMQLSTNSNYINSNNPSGYYYYRQYRFAANRGYDPNYIMRYNGTSWTILCGTGITSWCVPNDYISYTNNNKVFITYYRRYNFDTDTDGIKSASPIDMSQYNIADYTSIYYFEEPIDLIITQTRLDSFNTILNIILDDFNGLALGGNVLYSYNNDSFYPLNIDENGEIATLPVYTNGDVYFKVIDSNDNVILEKTFNVTGMPSISGYSVYEIPKGNNQIYISNLGNSTIGNFYIPFTMKGFSENFTYLDSNGDLLGSEIFDFTSFDDLGVDTVSGADLGLVTVSYNFSNLQNVKIISFNHNSNDNLIIWIPNSFYLDYVDLDNQSNYHCEGDSNINDSINLAKCYLKFDYNDNGTITQIEDSTSNAANLGNSEYFNQVVQVIKFNMPTLKGVTQDFTLFINSLDINLRYGFFFIFATFFIVAIMKLSKL